ncbi:MAG: dihydrofolate reductase [Candidatus Levybacteria bacterium]|nr:dihydrofolate reductase [Candidatus Levybacteria bacterium]
MKVKIILIAALSENRAIGKGNQLIWKIPEDLKRFKEITSGHPVIMGRKTFESIGRILPNRLNIVISRNPSFARGRLAKLKPEEKIVIAHSLDEALSVAQKNVMDDNVKKEVFIIGGGQIFEQAIGRADKLYLTIIEGQFKGDAFFPEYSNFKKMSESEIKEYKELRYRFEEWERK